MSCGQFYYTVKDDNGNLIPQDISSKKKQISESIIDRIVSEKSSDMRRLTSESKWSAWNNMAIRWDQKSEQIVTTPLTPDLFCTHKQNFDFPSVVTLENTDLTTKTLMEMLGAEVEDPRLHILEFYIGAALLKHNPKKALWLRGGKGIGKSLYTSIFAAMFSTGATVTLDIRQENNFLFEGIVGKSAVIQPEMPNTVLPHQELLRSAIQGGEVPLNEKGKGKLTIYPKAIWICASNFNINIGRGSVATLDRFCVVPAIGPDLRGTKKEIPDYHLELLEEEGYEIRIRCIARFVEMMKNNQNGWKEAQAASKSELQEALCENSVEHQFFQRFCEVTNDRKDKIFCGDFSQKYIAWLKANGSHGFTYTPEKAKVFLQTSAGITITTSNRQNHSVFGKNAYYAPGVKWSEEVEELDLASIGSAAPAFSKADSDSLLAGF
jgi:phage/plasmid-associated DNA primase